MIRYVGCDTALCHASTCVSCCVVHPLGQPPSHACFSSQSQGFPDIHTNCGLPDMLVRGDDGKFHMLASEITEHCGIDAWTSNSHVVHAVSDTPGGTYTRLPPPHREVSAAFVGASPAGSHSLRTRAFLALVILRVCAKMPLVLSVGAVVDVLLDLLCLFHVCPSANRGNCCSAKSSRENGDSNTCTPLRLASGLPSVFTRAQLGTGAHWRIRRHFHRERPLEPQRHPRLPLHRRFNRSQLPAHAVGDSTELAELFFP